MEVDEAMQALVDFDARLDEIYALYLDAGRALELLADDLQKNQLNSLRRTINHLDGPKSIEEIDCCHILIGSGDPDDPNSILLHDVTQGEYKRRNRSGGSNHVSIGRFSIISIYSFWEDQYRGRFAEAIGVPKNSIKENVFGDIRLLRNSIVHHAGIAKKDIGKCLVFHWFSEGDTIIINNESMKAVVREIRLGLDNLSLTHLGKSANLARRIGWGGFRRL
jgi:hypothetical protein